MQLYFREHVGGPFTHKEGPDGIVNNDYFPHPYLRLLSNLVYVAYKELPDVRRLWSFFPQWFTSADQKRLLDFYYQKMAKELEMCFLDLVSMGARAHKVRWAHYDRKRAREEFFFGTGRKYTWHLEARPPLTEDKLDVISEAYEEA
jgi:hypothetical protein